MATSILATFPTAWVVQLVDGDAVEPDAVVERLHEATVTITDRRISAIDGEDAWSWLVADLQLVAGQLAADARRA